jgi:hypothetical protein
MTVSNPRKEIIMNASTATATSSSSSSSTSVRSSEYWDRVLRLSGFQFVFLAPTAYVLFGRQPQIAAAIGGMAALTLMWFAASLRATLVAAGKEGWASAVSASSAAVGALLLMIITLRASATGLDQLTWATVVMTSFPRAMLIMSGSFGLWRAGRISDAGFGVAIAMVVLVLAGGTTWAADGFWAPDGLYSRLISPLLSLASVLVVNGVLVRRPPAHVGW